MGNKASRGISFVAFLCAFALLTSCGGGGGGGGTTGSPAASVQTGTATGTVIDGPISGAIVEVFDFTGNVKGVKLGTGTSDSSGNYSITLSPRPTGPVLVQASGGSYVDDVTGGTVTLGSTDILTEVVPASSIASGVLTAHVNPLNHMAATLAQRTAGNLGAENAVTFAKTVLGQQYGISVTDLASNPPLSASNPAPTSAPTLNQRQAGVFMAGLAQRAQALGVRTIDLIKALADDYSDGVLDGKNGSTPISIPKTGGVPVPLTATTGLADLQTSINAFLSSSRNSSGLTSMPPIAPQPIAIPALNTAGLVFGKSDMIPAFITGQTSTFQLQAGGGTPPYNWTNLTGCPGATVSASGLLTATGATLPSGSSILISAPCEVTVTDTRNQSAKVTFRITTVAAAPTITARTGLTMTTGVPGTVVLADASGGTPPYFFQKDTGALVPLGTSVLTSSDKLSAVLSGTPSQAGTYTFSVCVADLGRTNKCTNATVTVNDPPKMKLNVAGAGTGTGTFSTSPAGTSCGTGCVSFNQGTVVTVSASPASGSVFSGWSGSGCSGTGNCVVTLNADANVTATFTIAAPTSVNLTKAFAGTGSGTVATSVTGTSCGANCTTFAPGTSMSLTATPASGSIFAGWSGAGCSGTGACLITLNSSQTATATFNAVSSTPLTGTWVGTWSWTGPGISSTGQVGCTFNDGGAFTINITQSGTSYSGTANGNGIQTRNFSQGCALVSTDPASGSINGTVSGSNLTVGFNLDTLVFSGTATFDGTTISSTFVRTTGGTGSFSVTRQGGTASVPFSNGANSATATSFWRRPLTQSTEQIAFYADNTGSFISGGTCANGTITWSQTSSTSISVNLPATTAFTNSCPRTYTFTNISVGGGQFSATLDRGSGGSPVTYTQIGGHI